MVGQYSSTALMLSMTVVQATITFDIDDRLLQAGGYMQRAPGVYQQPYFPFSNAATLNNAPPNLLFAPGFPQIDGSGGLKPLKGMRMDGSGRFFSIVVGVQSSEYQPRSSIPGIQESGP